MNPRAILFDLDGTLTDSSEGILACVKESLKPFGIDLPRATLTEFIGPPLTWSYPHFCSLTAEQTEQAVAAFQARYAVDGKFENRVYPGIPSVLSALRARGYLLAVATSKPELFAREIIAHFSLDTLFASVRGGDMEETGTKADVIRRVLSDLSLPPEEAVMVGDRRHDVLGAREVGCPAVGVLWGFGSREELEESGAAAIIRTPEELLPLFPA